MTLLVSLQGERCAQRYTELEVTRRIGLVEGRSAFDGNTVEQEMYIARRHGTVFVQHTTRATNRGYIGEIDILADTIVQS